MPLHVQEFAHRKGSTRELARQGNHAGRILAFPYVAHIVPFRALRYDSAKLPLSQVVTQPYDKITPEMQGKYHAASPHNLVRIILGNQQPTDTPADNRYTRADAYFRDWRREGIFLQDSEPSIYLYIQQFTIPGCDIPLKRSGFIALGRIEDYSAGVVFRHEQTLARPKADRLELLRATRAHFGQIFMLYSDPANEILDLLEASPGSPQEITDEYGVLHRIARVSDPNLIGLVRSKMRDRQLIIADGHHRYETALAYRNEHRTQAASISAPGVPRERSSDAAFLADQDVEQAPYEMVMMTFVNMDAPGLAILPTHRVVHGLPSFNADEFREQASKWFSVEEVDPEIDPQRANVILREAGHTGPALLAVSANRAFLLDRPNAISSGIFAGLSLEQQSLDVVQLHKCVLERTLGLSDESIRNQQNISYLRDASEALAQVRSGAANVAFLMNPVQMQQVRNIAFRGEVLPQKSTDFYPKLLSGLTIYALD
jgi:uncharacterized protein (DUF1015 family)